jgi:chromosome segregation ATPase
MPVRLKNYSKIFISLCLILSFCLIEGEAQTRRKRTRRTTRPAAPKPVITNPAIAPSTDTQATTQTGDVKIISTADSTTEQTEQAQEKKPKTAKTEADPEEVQQTITNLSTQVNRLADKLSQMQEDDRFQLDMERLTRAEQRAEQIRMQLVDVQSKIADFEAKLEGVEYALRPENIERSMQTFGSTRPEEAREARRRQLESERGRLKAQLKILETSKSRLEVSSSLADNEVDLLRAKLQQRREQMDAAPAADEKRETRPKPRKPDTPAPDNPVTPDKPVTPDNPF